ncbi:glycosyltransferase family 1 protein, partial [Nostoc sp. CHAB 5834]|nr:glycosyltransferase family 1 protein [Nostoc sp. CHAB 5834]
DLLLSDKSSLPEVGGDAALYFEPSDVDSIRNTIQLILDDFSLRQKMIDLGLNRIKHFSWQNTVDKTIKSYESIL